MLNAHETKSRKRRVETAGDIFGITQIPYNKPTF